jgi:adenine-specific DNA-methyltransferase
MAALRTPSHGTLRPSLDKSLRFDLAKQVVVSGDNLETMKLMQKAYGGKFKLIFADPPYNLPSDIIYDDDLNDPLERYLRFVDQVEKGKPVSVPQVAGRTHSRWLSMMLPRLFVMRNLLSQDGVICVSIDDHESHHLRLLMDEVFGAENFVCCFVWEKRYSPAPDAKNVGYVHDNILCYRRSDEFESALLPMTEAQRARYKNPDHDPRGPWKAADYTCRYTAEERPTLYYPVINPNTGEKVLPKKTRVWACSEDEHMKNVKEQRIWWPPESAVPARKKFLSEIRQGAMPKTLLLHKEVGHTDQATKELRRWFPKLKMSGKPTKLIQHFLSIANVQTGDFVLDPFARTGVTSEAVIRTNKEAGKSIRFVLIQLQEPIEGQEDLTLSDVAIERSIRVMKKMDSRSKDGVRVFRLDRSSFKQWNGQGLVEKDAIAQQLSEISDNLVRGRSEEDILFELLLKAGFPLSTEVKSHRVNGKRFFSVSEGALLVCLEGQVDMTLVRELVKKQPERIVLLDVAFGGDDQLRTNAALEIRNRGIELLTA